MLPTLSLSLEPPLAFMALAGVLLLACVLLQLPFWTPWYPLARLSAGARRGAASHWWLQWLNPPSGASCPFLSFAF